MHATRHALVALTLLAPVALAQGIGPVSPGAAEARDDRTSPAAPQWLQTDLFFDFDATDFEQFGESIALDGDLALIGASGRSQTPHFLAGGAALFERTLDGRWLQAWTFASPMPVTFGGFGNSVALAPGVGVVGASGADHACPGLLNCRSGEVVPLHLDASGAWTTGSILVPADSDRLDRFGSSVAVAGGWLAAGAPGEGDSGSALSDGDGHGAVYLYERTGFDTWTERAKLLPPVPQLEQEFGSSIAMTDTTLVVGAPSRALAPPPGSVFVFDRVGTSWSLTATLQAISPLGGDAYGARVALDGTRLAVGARGTDRVELFERVGGGWVLRTELDVSPFGALQQIALDGERLVATTLAPGDAPNVHVFRRQGVSRWELETQIAGPNSLGQRSVALDGDRLMTSDPLDSGDGTTQERGSVYAYEFGFTQPDPAVGRAVQRLPHAAQSFGAELASHPGGLVAVGTLAGPVVVLERFGGGFSPRGTIAPPLDATSTFGQALAVVPGRVLVADPTRNGTGVVDVFEQVAGAWTRVDELVGSDVPPAAPFTPAPRFGASLAADGARLLAGCPGTNAVYAFEDVGGAYVELQKLTSPTGDSGDQFGNALALHGDVAAIGAFRQDTTVLQGGAVHTFANVGGAWNATEVLWPAPGTGVARFGQALALDGTRLAVAAPLDDAAGADAGSVTLFTRSAGAWTLEQRVEAAAPAEGELFGSAVALAGDTLLVGASQSHAQGFRSGLATLYHRVGGTWRVTESVLPDDTARGDQLGTSAALIGDRLLVGSPHALTELGTGLVHVLADDGPTPPPFLGVHPRFRSAGEPLAWEVARGPAGAAASLWLVHPVGAQGALPVGVVADVLDVGGTTTLTGTFDELGRWRVEALAPPGYLGPLTFRALAVGHTGLLEPSNDVVLVLR